MKDRELIFRAALYSRAAHQAVGQQRKYTGEPYYRHPASVAEIVSQAEHVTPEMLAAAYLHDVVEDTDVTHEDISRDFGLVVSGYVFELTDQFIDLSIGNRAHRKKLERERLSRIHPNAQTIKYADLIDNTSSIVSRDPGFARVYLKEKRALLSVMRHGDEALRKMAWGALEEGEEIIA